MKNKAGFASQVIHMQHILGLLIIKKQNGCMGTVELNIRQSNRRIFGVVCIMQLLHQFWRNYASSFWMWPYHQSFSVHISLQSGLLGWTEIMFCWGLELLSIHLTVKPSCNLEMHKNNAFLYQRFTEFDFVLCSLETGERSRHNINDCGVGIYEPTGPQPHPSG